MSALRRLRVPLFQIDAFSAKPFSGNPAAVALLDGAAKDLPDTTRQSIAAEMNLSETAFLEPMDQPSTSGGAVWSSGNTFRLRWFTPTVEVPLCGHATLAAAAALIGGCNNNSPSLHFQTLSGELVVSRAAASPPASTESASAQQPLLLEMSLPLSDPTDAVPAAAADAAGPFIRAAVGDLKVKDIAYNARLGYVLVRLDESCVTRQQLEAIKPDISGIMASGAHHAGAKAVIVSLAGDAASPSSGFDILSRFFGPALGVDEDPVTGSAHAVLGPYYARQFGGRTELSARQCSARGGETGVRVDTAAGRVVLSAAATIVLEGSLYV